MLSQTLSGGTSGRQIRVRLDSTALTVNSRQSHMCRIGTAQVNDLMLTVTAFVQRPVSRRSIGIQARWFRRQTGPMALGSIGNSAQPHTSETLRPAQLDTHRNHRFFAIQLSGTCYTLIGYILFPQDKLESGIEITIHYPLISSGLARKSRCRCQ